MRFFFFLFSLVYVCIGSVAAQDIPSRPQPARFVNDYAGLFSSNSLAWQNLENRLAFFSDSTSTQIIVVTLDSLPAGYGISEVAYAIGEKWGVGQAGKNNGVVMLVKPKSASSAGSAFIATGYGLEGALTDVACSRIVRNVMIPYFKADDYVSGIYAGAEAIVLAARGEDFGPVDDGSSADDADLSTLYFILFVLIVLLVYYVHEGVVRGKAQGITSPFSLGLFAIFYAIGHVLSLIFRASASASVHGGGGSFGGNGGGRSRSYGGGHFGGGGGGGSW